MPTLFLHDGRDCASEVFAACSERLPSARMELWPADAAGVSALLAGVDMVVLLGGLNPALGRLALDRLDAVLASAGEAGVSRVVLVDGWLPIEPEACPHCGPGPARPEHLTHVLVDGAPRGARGAASRLDAWARALGGRLLTSGGVSTTLLATGFLVRDDGSAPAAAALVERLGADLDGVRMPDGWVNFLHVRDLADLLVSLRRAGGPRHEVLLAAGQGDQVSRLAIWVAQRLGRVPATGFVRGAEARVLVGRYRAGGARSGSLPRWTSVLVEEILAGCPWDTSAARARLGREWTPVVPLLLEHARRRPARAELLDEAAAPAK